MGIASLPLEIQLILVPTILFALTFHEYAHARVAYLLGDYTSYYQNRMNLNPFNHLDPFGTFALYFLGFGWAKPVPVVMQNLKNPRSDMMMIAMAGPASNMFLACLASIIFNLIPLNPLDGSRILPLLVRNPRTLYNIEIYGPRILIGLIILNLIGIPILSTIILTPVSIIFYLLTGA